MPGAYTIDVERSIVLSRGWETLTFREILAHGNAVAADPRFRPHFRQFIDYRRVTDLAVTADEMRALAKASPFGKGARRAWVVNTIAEFGMARMYQTLRNESGDELEIFRDVPSALLWLGLADAGAELMAALDAAPALSAPR